MHFFLLLLLLVAKKKKKKLKTSDKSDNISHNWSAFLCKNSELKEIIYYIHQNNYSTMRKKKTLKQ